MILWMKVCKLILERNISLLWDIEFVNNERIAELAYPFVNLFVVLICLPYLKLVFN